MLLESGVLLVPVPLVPAPLGSLLVPLGVVVPLPLWPDTRSILITLFTPLTCLSWRSISRFSVSLFTVPWMVIVPGVWEIAAPLGSFNVPETSFVEEVDAPGNVDDWELDGDCAPLGSVRVPEEELLDGL